MTKAEQAAEVEGLKLVRLIRIAAHPRLDHGQKLAKVRKWMKRQARKAWHAAEAVRREQELREWLEGKRMPLPQPLDRRYSPGEWTGD